MLSPGSDNTGHKSNHGSWISKCNKEWLNTFSQDFVIMIVQFHTYIKIIESIITAISFHQKTNMPLKDHVVTKNNILSMYRTSHPLNTTNSRTSKNTWRSVSMPPIQAPLRTTNNNLKHSPHTYNLGPESGKSNVMKLSNSYIKQFS